ncbi:winged helix-turn-helix domain-containing protein [Nonomuraea sp. NPDC046802]|uniref:winged helix-turn-helix domain-containing protein n=1 Tax=Nonomuraea sp. NPDC046802 TaxID=3154919 RepID=UPI0033D5938B
MADLVRIDADARQAWLGATRLELLPMEFRLLSLLVSNAGTLVPQKRVLQEVWDTELVGARKTLGTTLCRLRKALGDDSRYPTYITTVGGEGLRFEAAMVAPSETRVVDIDGRRYDVLHWEKHPFRGATSTFTLHARPVEAVSDGLA